MSGRDWQSFCRRGSNEGRIDVLIRHYAHCLAVSNRGECGQASLPEKRMMGDDECLGGMNRLLRTRCCYWGFEKPRSEDAGCHFEGVAGGKEDQGRRDCRVSGC